jgi:hypothetical protein
MVESYQRLGYFPRRDTDTKGDIPGRWLVFASADSTTPVAFVYIWIDNSFVVSSSPTLRDELSKSITIVCEDLGFTWKDKGMVTNDIDPEFIGIQFYLNHDKPESTVFWRHSQQNIKHGPPRHFPYLASRLRSSPRTMQRKINCAEAWTGVESPMPFIKVANCPTDFRLAIDNTAAEAWLKKGVAKTPELRARLTELHRILDVKQCTLTVLGIDTNDCFWRTSTPGTATRPSPIGEPDMRPPGPSCVMPCLETHPSGSECDDSTITPLSFWLSPIHRDGPPTDGPSPTPCS